MDLLLSSPDPVATNLMGSDFVQVPELNGPVSKSEDSQGEADTPLQLLPPPPPLIPAPEITTMEEVKSGGDTPTPLPAVDFVAQSPVPPPPPQETLEEELNRLISEAHSFQPMRVDDPPTSTTPNCPQIMTRKRSSMSAGSGIGSNIMSSPATSTEQSQVYMEGPVNEVPIAVAAVSTSAAPPPKKKKKYAPKSKKTPTAPSLPITVPLLEGSAPPPPPPPAKPNKPMSTKKKTSPVAGPVAVSGGAPIVDNKPKKPSKPKAPKKKPTGCGIITTNSKSKSSSKKKTNVTPPPPNSLFPQNQQPSVEGERGRLVPPLKILMPKLTKMVASVVKVEPGEGEDWDENVEPLDPLVLAETELLDASEGANGGGKGGRKKKSKGRNGNIYIGVFNRIEWMKLQNEFGFGSVNNFGTFVLQTMRRVHGDIQFWCDVAAGSGIYPDLDHYKWTNGFPHAVNKEAQYFTPEPDVTISEEKREEVIQMAKGMWDQRLLALKQQQQQLTGEEGVAGEDAVIEEPDVVEVDEEEEDDEEDPLMMPGLENYLENMASGRYSPLAPGVSGDGGGCAQSSSSASKTVALTEEEVNKIWNEQMNDSDNVEKFGKLFSFINSIADIGKREDGEIVRDAEEAGGAAEENPGKEGEGQEGIVGVGAN